MGGDAFSEEWSAVNECRRKLWKMGRNEIHSDIIIPRQYNMSAANQTDISADFLFYTYAKMDCQRNYQ